MNLYLHIKHGMLVRAIPDHQPNPVSYTRNARRAIPDHQSQHGGISTKHSEPTSPAQSPETGKVSGRARKGGEYEGLLYYVSHGWLIIAKQEFSVENSCRLKNYRM